MNNNQGYNGGRPLFDNDFNNPNNMSGVSNNNPYNQNNNINNNQGFNGTNPLFSNDFNNINNAGSSFNNLYNQNNFSNMNQPDMPPELGEIKNLNEATVSEAPTMDVLGPAPLPNQGLPMMQDPIEAYEQNGFSAINNSGFNNSMNQFDNYSMPQNIPSSYQNYSYPNQELSMPNMNPVPNYGMNQPAFPQNNYDFNGLNNMQTNNYRNEMPINNFGVPPLNAQIPSMPYEGVNPNMDVRSSYFNNEKESISSSLPPMSSDILNTSFNKEYQASPNMSFDMPSNNMENEINNFSSLNNENINQTMPPMSSDILNASFNKENEYQIPSDISNDTPSNTENNINKVSSFENELNLPSLPEFDENILNNSFNKENEYEMPSFDIQNNDIEVNSSRLETDLDTNDTSMENDTPIITEEEKPYEIINDKIENNDLLDMRLDESYDEPDSLEIMDVDGDEETVLRLPALDDKVKANLDKIKKLVEEIKATGDKIEIEEFDFDGMYQIIIKLEK